MIADENFEEMVSSEGRKYARDVNTILSLSPSFSVSLWIV